MNEQNIPRPGRRRLPSRPGRIGGARVTNVELFLEGLWVTPDSVWNWQRIGDELQGAHLFCIWVIPDGAQEEIRGLLRSALDQARARRDLADFHRSIHAAV